MKQQKRNSHKLVSIKGALELPVWFQNPQGFTLSGDLILPSRVPPHPVIVFSHGMYSGKESPRNRKIAESLLEAGFAVLLFDFTGHGKSEGLLEESTIEQQVEDLGAALDFLETHQDKINLLLVGINGSSTGGTVALLRASIDDRIRAMVLRSARMDNTLDAARLISIPTLLIVGEMDSVTAHENRVLYMALGGKKELEVIPGAGHLFDEPGQMERVTNLTVLWFAENLPG